MKRWDPDIEDYIDETNGEEPDIEDDIRFKLDMVEMIRTELGDKKAALAQTTLKIPELDYSMSFHVGMWLRHAEDEVTRVRLEILEVRDETCLVYCVGWEEPTEKTKKILCWYRISEPPSTALPSWVKPGAYFGSNSRNRWCILTIKEGMFTAKRTRDQYFATWTSEDLFDECRPILTAWEQLDDLG